MLSTLGILKVIALKGFPFTEVPLSEQPLTCSPSRAGCSGFVWKAPCFPAALAPQLSPVWHPQPVLTGALLLLGIGLGLGAVQLPGSQQCLCRLQELSILDVTGLDD